MKKGFSLAEILVSISILTILSAIGIQTYITAQRSAKLKADVITVTSAIRTAQNRALSPSRGDLVGILDTDKLCAMGVRFTDQKKLQPYYVVESATGACTNSQDYGGEIVLGSAAFQYSGDLEFSLPFATNTTGNQSIQLQLSGVTAKTITVTESGLIKIE